MRSGSECGLITPASKADPFAAEYMRTVEAELRKLDVRPTVRRSEVLEATAQACGVSVSDLLGTRRFREVIRAKRVATICLRDVCGCSFPEIAMTMNLVNHSSAVVRYHADHDDDTRAMVERVREIVLKDRSEV